MLNYKELIDYLPVEDINSAIAEMVRSYDKNGVPYVVDVYSEYEGILKKFLTPTKEFYDIVDKTIIKEYEEDKERAKNGDGISLDLFDGIHESTFEEYARNIRRNIFEYLLKYLSSEAKKISDNRSELRVSAGDKVDLKECMYAYKYLNKIEFYKDGGWGIAEEDGTIIIKNHLMKQPSQTSPIKTNSNCRYRIIQDRDTKKFGVMSVLPFYEAILCHYDKIEVVDYFNNYKNSYFLKVIINDKWGCYNENCALLIDSKYDDISFKYGFFEGVNKCEDGSYLQEKNNNNCTIVKSFLYDSDGNFIFGGYNSFEMEMNYMKFYFGAFYEYYFVEEKDFYGEYIDVEKRRMNYSNSVCLVLDKSFKSIIRDKNRFYQLAKGKVFDSKEQLLQSVPASILFRYHVDLSNINKGFIFLNDYHGEQYIIPYYIQRGFETPELYDEYLTRLNGLIDPLASDEEETSFVPSEYNYYNDQYEDDSLTTIIKLNKEHKIKWFDFANEIYSEYNSTILYRRGHKCGFINNDGLIEALYNGISLESPDNKVYVALFEPIHDNNIESNERFNNPNIIQFGLGYMRYYELLQDGQLVRVDDNWNVFNPLNCKWYPNDFIEKNYNYDSGLTSDFISDNNDEWTDEDAWDAMTDGMYGDYPGPEWDPEHFGY